MPTDVEVRAALDVIRQLGIPELVHTLFGDYTIISDPRFFACGLILTAGGAEWTKTQCEVKTDFDRYTITVDPAVGESRTVRLFIDARTGSINGQCVVGTKICPICDGRPAQLSDAEDSICLACGGTGGLVDAK